MPFNQFIPRAADAIQDAQNLFTCIEYLRYTECEKHLLYFTGGGLFFPEGNSDYDKNIAGAANDALVVIDTFHTGGLSPTLPGAGPLFPWANTASAQALKSISAFTGGHSSIYQDIGKSLEVINQTSRFEYLLGYYPTDQNWNGKYRQIEIKVNRPGLKLYFRRGYFARDRLQPYDRDEFLAYNRISAAVAYPENIDDVPFKISSAKGSEEGGQHHVKIDLKIGVARLALKDVVNLHAGKLRFAVYYQDAGSRPLGNLWGIIDLNLKEETYREYLKSGMPVSLEIPAPTKNLMIKVVIYDALGDRVGSRYTRIEQSWRP